MTTQIIKYWLLGLIVFCALLVIPYFPNFLLTSKYLLVFISGIGVFGLYLFTSLAQKTWRWNRHPLVWPLLAWFFATLVSTFLTNNYPVENLLGWGGLMLSLALLSLIGGSLVDQKFSRQFYQVLNLTGVLVALTTISQFLSFSPYALINIFTDFKLASPIAFSLTGSPFIAAQVLGLSLIGLIIYAFSHRSQLWWSLGSGLIMVIGLVLNIYLLLPGKPANLTLLPFSASWTIALDVLKQPKAIITGVGADSYLSAYLAHRPLWINNQAYWNVNFIQASDFPLSLVVTGGILSLASWLGLVTVYLKNLRHFYQKNPVPTIVGLVSLLYNFLFPVNIVIMTIQMGCLVSLISDEHSQSSWSFKWHPIINTSLMIVSVVFSGGLCYFLGRAYLALYQLNAANVAINRGDLVTAYTLNQKSVLNNPYLTQSRMNYALINLNAANILANKADLSVEEKTQITQLLQQAIREAKAATLIRPDLSTTWQVLGQIYGQLIGNVEGADQWTVTAYVSAANQAPFDPVLRLELGEIFLRLNNYQQAAGLYAQAADLKPNLPAAYYGLAKIAKALKNQAETENYYQKTLSLLDPNSQEYQTVNQELTEIKKNPFPIETKTTQKPTEAATTSLSSLTNQNLNQNESLVSSPAAELTAVQGL